MEIHERKAVSDELKKYDHLGEYKDLGHCECCGDWISNYTLEI